MNIETIKVKVEEIRKIKLTKEEIKKSINECYSEYSPVVKEEIFVKINSLKESIDNLYTFLTEKTTTTSSLIRTNIIQYYSQLQNIVKVDVSKFQKIPYITKVLDLLNDIKSYIYSLSRRSFEDIKKVAGIDKGTDTSDLDQSVEEKKVEEEISAEN